MAKFHVKDTFTIEGRPHFILAGSIMEGEIRAGMFVRIPFNSSLTKTARIDCIEFARILGGQESVCLCLRYANPEELEMWRALEVRDATVEITTDGET